MQPRFDSKSNDSENNLTKSSLDNQWKYMQIIRRVSPSPRSITTEYRTTRKQNRSCCKFGTCFFPLHSLERFFFFAMSFASQRLFFFLLIDVMIHGERNTWTDSVVALIFLLLFSFFFVSRVFVFIIYLLSFILNLNGEMLPIFEWYVISSNSLARFNRFQADFRRIELCKLSSFFFVSCCLIGADVGLTVSIMLIYSFEITFRLSHSSHRISLTRFQRIWFIRWSILQIQNRKWRMTNLNGHHYENEIFMLDHKSRCFIIKTKIFSSQRPFCVAQVWAMRATLFAFKWVD